MKRRNLLAALALSLTPALPLIPTAALAQNRRKEVLAFYYGWYGTPGRSGAYRHWTNPDLSKRTLDDAKTFPKEGLYDSRHPGVMERHAVTARQAGITGLICSWWGRGDPTDRQLPAFLDTLHKQGVRATAYVEKPRGVGGTAADILYLLKTYAGHPAWLRADGKPVVFLFDRVIQDLGLDGWARVRARVRRTHPDVLFAGTANTVEEINQRKPHFDILHLYSLQFEAGKPRLDQKAWRQTFTADWVKAQDGLTRTTATIMPGFDDGNLGRDKPQFVGREDGDTYRQFWDSAIAAKPDWVLIVSFNEWHEDSQIEPSDRDGDREFRTTKAKAAVFRSG